MPNYRISSGDKFFSRGVPFHAVDFTCYPLDVRGVAAEFGKLGNWQNMVQRVVQPKNDLFASVGATVVLVAEFLADQFRVLGGFQTVNRGLLKIAAFTKWIAFSDHGWERGIFTAVRTDPAFSPCLFAELAICYASISAWLTVNFPWSCWFRAKHTKTLLLQSVIPLGSSLATICSAFGRSLVTTFGFSLFFTIGKMVHWAIVSQNPVNVGRMEV